MITEFLLRIRNLLALTFAIAAAARLEAQAAGAEVATVVKRTLLQELNLPAIWFLVGCSLLVVWLVIDLYQKSWARRLLPPADLARVKECFSRGDYQAALDHCSTARSAFCEAVGAALRHGGAGMKPAEDAVAGSLAGSNSRFQTKISYLSVIGVIAPMVGLAGTVLGMIDAFALMGQAGAADPSRLSGAIGHVLHATAGGLIVAIPAFVFHYLLRNRIGHRFQEVGFTIAELFRNFPYEDFAGRSLAGAEPCAARPVWAARDKISETQPKSAEGAFEVT
ncbi:MAG: MotA/TolQ/ExbB proton channel family protein [Opitutaceae bacterium]|nr:MotA/TolQ/ExbB proton channel family protein [Opitutaceae bacterium]